MIKGVIKMANNEFPFEEAGNFAKWCMEIICPGHTFKAKSFELIFRSRSEKFTGVFLDELANMYYKKLCNPDE